MTLGASKGSYRPSLDGLRALAMYLIVLFHAEVPWARGSFIAVNLFFVLSGYLVTALLLREIDSTGRIRLARFYARRVRRLLPAAIAAVIGISLAWVLLQPLVRRIPLMGDARASLLYFANWRFLAESTDYFATHVHKSPFLHFWTLSIEEQFYVFFPLLLLLLAKVRRPGRRWVLLSFAAVVCAASVAAQLYWARENPVHAYFGTDARAYQLAFGALLALVLHYFPVRVSPPRARATAVTGLTILLVLCLPLVPMSRPVRGLAGTLACVLLIGGLMLAEDQWLGRLLSRRTPVYLGQISYATYLWHWPVVLAVQEFLDLRPIGVAVLAGFIATGIAAASGELLERPIRSTPRLDRLHQSTALVGVTASALVAVLLVPPILSWDRRPSVKTEEKGKISPAARLATPEHSQAPKLPANVDWKKIADDKGRQVTCTRDNVSACTVHRGSGPHVLLVGDSHAVMMTQMFTQLAKEHDFTLSVNALLGCPWQQNLKNVQSGPPRQKACTAARVGWYDEVLPKLHPDVVVIASFPRENEKHWQTRLVQRNGRHDPLRVAELRATKRTLAKIEQHTKRVALVQTIVTANTFNPDECLTRTGKPSKCQVPLPIKSSHADGINLTEATADPDVFTVNLNPAFCPDAPLCQPVVDGRIVWRDDEHLTPGFATSRKDQVWRLITRSGVLDGLP